MRGQEFPEHFLCFAPGIHPRGVEIANACIESRPEQAKRFPRAASTGQPRTAEAQRHKISKKGIADHEQLFSNDPNAIGTSSTTIKKQVHIAVRDSDYIIPVRQFGC
jgi:hypothetical protein